ncbi:hypothetical protein HRbin02_00585 [Candidatus Calditenuaceae archaeon HR02]|nr:hypothetical protein HRbin02_00585 [Candidatus Calditenuaceae archaeon HR02]
MSQRLESLISLVLATGVVLSLAILAIALAFYLSNTGPEIVLSDKYRVISPNFFEYMRNIAKIDFGASGLMAIGLILLMLTPYARVIASFTYFAARRDVKYSLITAFVLLVLTVSLLTH